MSGVRRRVPARPATDEAAEPDAAEPASPWHSTRMVRLIIVALVLFALMHLFLWKVVYDFWRAENHDRLSQTVREAKDSLYRVLEHL